MTKQRTKWIVNIWPLGSITIGYTVCELQKKKILYTSEYYICVTVNKGKLLV